MEGIASADADTTRANACGGAVLQPVRTEQRYSILFNFGSSFLNYQYSEVILDRVARAAVASNARSVEITGFAASDGYAVSGGTLREASRRRVDIVLSP